MSYDYRLENDGRHVRAQRSRRDRPADYRDSYVDVSGPRGSRQMELVRRPREDSDVEEIPRDFPPPGAHRRRQRARSDDRGRDSYAGAGYGGRSDHGRGDDHRGSRGRSLSRAKEAAAAAGGAGIALGANELWERRDGGKHRPRSKSRVRQAALGVAGAVAGDVAARQYSKRHGDDHHHKRHSSGGRGAAAAYYGDSDDDPRGGRPKPSRRKSLSEAAIGALGLKELLGNGDPRDDRGRRRHHRRSSSGYSSSRSATPDKLEKYQQAAKAALLAAGAEAWRSRKDPGGFFEGPKARRILTAAAGAGGINGIADRHPEKNSTRDATAGALGGLLLNRAVNGSRNDDYSRSRSRSRHRSRGRRGSSRSQSRGGGLKDLAGAAVAAGVGKKLYDKVRSRSRSKGRRYSSSEGSPSPKPRNRRSRSVSEYLDRGMNKLGLGAATGAGAGAGAVASRRRDRDDDYDQGRGGTRDAARGAGAGARGHEDDDSDSEFSLEQEEKNRRKLRGKEFLTAGLATVATVHAAHEVYEGYEKRQMRQKMVREGDMTPEQARKLKYKSNAKDAATVGLAALGIKGVVDNWKEAQEQRKQCHECETRLEYLRRKAAEREQRIKQQALSNTDSWRHSDPNLAGGYYNGGSGPVYQDGNPYAAGGGGGGGSRRH